jgi:hypothetical protein
METGLQCVAIGSVLSSRGSATGLMVFGVVMRAGLGLAVEQEVRCIPEKLCATSASWRSAGRGRFESNRF